MNKTKIGTILELFISSSETKSREQKDVIDVDCGGVLLDKHYGKDVERSVLIISTDSYEKAKQNGIDVNFGDLGENILVDCNPYDLPAGSKLYCLDVVLEIAHKASLCPSLSKVNSKLPKLLKNDRGIFAKVLQGGTMCKGEEIFI